jgi:hypothetical protein
LEVSGAAGDPVTEKFNEVELELKSWSEPKEIYEFPPEYVWPAVTCEVAFW